MSRGREGGFGRSFAVRAQSRWLDWPDELEQPLLQPMEDNHAATRSGELEQTTAITQHFGTIITGLVNARRMRRIGGRGVPVDPTDELAHDFLGDVPLLLAEILSILRNSTAGDLGTISRCVGSIVHCLAQHPELRADMRRRIATRNISSVRYFWSLLLRTDTFNCGFQVTRRRLRGQSVFG